MIAKELELFLGFLDDLESELKVLGKLNDTDDATFSYVRDKVIARVNLMCATSNLIDARVQVAEASKIVKQLD
jgi:hypothetical protein